MRRGWYHGWNIVAGAILTSIALMSLAMNSLSLFLADWSRELNAPISTLQLAITGFGIASAVVAPLAGMLVDRLHGRVLFVFGFAILASSELAIAFMTETWQLMAIYIVALPIAFMVLSLAGASVVMRWFVRRRGLAMALTAAGLGLSGMIVPPLVAAVMPEMGWRAVWQLGAAVTALAIAPFVVFVMRSTPDQRDNAYYAGADDAPTAGGAPLLQSQFRWADILGGGTFWLIVVTCLSALSLYGAVTQNLAPIAAQKGLDGRAAGSLLSVLFASQLLFTLLAGILSDKFGNRMPLAGFVIATAFGGVVVAYAQGTAAMAAGVALVGIGCAYFPLLTATIANEYGAAGFGRAYGLASGILCFAGFAPFFIARSREMTGAYDAALLTFAAAAMIAGILCGLLMRERGRPVPSVARAQDSPQAH